MSLLRFILLKNSVSGSCVYGKGDALKRNAINPCMRAYLIFSMHTLKRRTWKYVYAADFGINREDPVRSFSVCYALQYKKRLNDRNGSTPVI